MSNDITHRAHFNNDPSKEVFKFEFTDISKGRKVLSIRQINKKHNPNEYFVDNGLGEILLHYIHKGEHKTEKLMNINTMSLKDFKSLKNK